MASLCIPYDRSRVRAFDSTNKTAVVFMHPTGGGSYLPMLNSLAKQNIDTVWCDSRYRGTDSALIMEKVLIDLGNCIKSLKLDHGYEKIVLGGWSGYFRVDAFGSE